MKKLILFFSLILSVAIYGQTPQQIQQPLQLNSVATATATPDFLVRGTDRLVKKMPWADVFAAMSGAFTLELNDVTTTGNFTEQDIEFQAGANLRWNTGTYIGTLNGDGLTDNRSWNLPDANGKLALLENDLSEFVNESEDPFARLSDVSGTIPKITTDQKNAIADPINGQLVYDTDLKTLSWYDLPTETWKVTNFQEVMRNGGYAESADGLVVVSFDLNNPTEAVLITSQDETYLQQFRITATSGEFSSEDSENKGAIGTTEGKALLLQINSAGFTRVELDYPIANTTWKVPAKTEGDYLFASEQYVDEVISEIPEGITIGDVEDAVDSAISEIPTANGTTPGLSLNNYDDDEKDKLGSVSYNATMNDTDANLKNRTNHTGQQPASTISDFNTAAKSAAVQNNMSPSPDTAPSVDTVIDYVDDAAKAAANKVRIPIDIAVIADVHHNPVSNDGVRNRLDAEEKLGAAATVINSYKPDMTLFLGDFIDETTDVATILTTANTINGEKFHLIGNHDILSISKATFQAAVGMPSNYYFIDRHGIRFVFLDANYGLDDDSAHVVLGNYTHEETYVNPAQRTWLTSVLAASDIPVVINIHQNLSETSIHSVVNRAAVRSILEASGKVIAVFQGHRHANEYSVINNIPYYSFDDMTTGAFPENAYSIITIETDNTIRIKGFGTQTSYNLVDPYFGKADRTDVTVSSTTTETNLYKIHIPGGTFVVGDEFRVNAIIERSGTGNFTALMYMSTSSSSLTGGGQIAKYDGALTYLDFGRTFEVTTTGIAGAGFTGNLNNDFAGSTSAGYSNTNAYFAPNDYWLWVNVIPAVNTATVRGKSIKVIEQLRQ